MYFSKIKCDETWLLENVNFIAQFLFIVENWYTIDYDVEEKEEKKNEHVEHIEHIEVGKIAKRNFVKTSKQRRKKQNRNDI